TVPAQVSEQLAAGKLKLGETQLDALRILAAAPRPLTAPELAQAARCTLGPIGELRKKKLLKAEVKRIQQVEIDEVVTPRERHWHWQQIARSEIQVVVGARSAVFAPTPNLGLILIDEEHDGSFKQGESPRYHARDVALRRAAMEGVPLVLGSATPSLESWQRAVNGTSRLIDMPRRVEDRPL